jgi:hypothetical protein
MKRTSLKRFCLFAASIVALVAPASTFADPKGDEPHFYAVAQPSLGYVFGTATYDGPVVGGPPRFYEAHFQGTTVAATLGGAYRASSALALGARALGALSVNSSWESRIPGSGLQDYAALGAEVFGRSTPFGGEGLSVEVGVGYARFGFDITTDASLYPGRIVDEGAFLAMSGLVADVAVGWSSVRRPWIIEPRADLRYFRPTTEHGVVSAWFPSGGISIGLEVQ